MNINVTNFKCKRDSLTIKGMQYIPAAVTGSKLPAIIFSHGFTGNYSNMEFYCKELAADGYATFCFSFCGGSKPETDAALKSDGDSRDMNISTEILDLLTVITYIKTLPFIDTEQIILIGCSQGGLVSGLAAARYNEQISKLVMIYPALCIPDHARRGCLGGAHYDINHVPEEIHCPSTVIGRAFHEDVYHMDPYLELRAYTGSVLILHGLNDTIVDYSYSIRARDNYQPGQCRLQLIENMGHGPNRAQEAALAASIRQFLHDPQAAE